MKHISLNIVSAYLFAATTLLFSACSKDDSGSEGTGSPKNPDTAITPSADTGKDNTTDDVVTGGVAEISFTTATIYGYVNNSEQAALGMGITYAPTEDITKVSLEQLKEAGLTVEATSFDPGTDNRRFTVHLTNLRPNTTYSYYAYAGQMTANHVLKFKTPAVVLKTNAATDVTMFSATLNGSSNAGNEVDYGFIYSAREDFSDSIVVWYPEYKDGTIAYKLNNLMPGVTYYYKSCSGWREEGYYLGTYRTFDNIVSISNQVKSFTTTNLCPDNNHPHAVDLGLPSGTKWACCNVGAVHPDSLGNLYAWGETWPKNDNYLYDGQNIGEDIAGTQYDAATVNWGSGWRMPNEASFRELFNNTRKVEVYGKGIYCVANNEKAIFLRADKWQNIYWLSECDNSYNYYWAKSLEIEWNSSYSMGKTNYSSTIEYDKWPKRSGYPIRPVRAN